MFTGRYLASTIPGLDDVSKYPKLIEYLVSEGNWTDDDVAKLVGGNILRVMEKNEQVETTCFHCLALHLLNVHLQIALELKKTMKPQEGLISAIQLVKYNLTECRNLDMYPGINITAS